MYFFFFSVFEPLLVSHTPSDLCALSGTILGITTDWVKGSNSELQKLTQNET